MEDKDKGPFGRFGPPPPGVEDAKILGMPEILAASASVVMRCPNMCNNILLLQGQFGSIITCLKCQRNWVLGPFQLTADGQIRVGIGEAVAKPGQGKQG